MASSSHWSLKAVKFGRTAALFGAATATAAAVMTPRERQELASGAPDAPTIPSITGPTSPSPQYAEGGAEFYTVSGESGALD